jgi:hypothetical protein
MGGPQARRAKPGWSDKQTGSRRDKIPKKPPPLVVVRDFEVCHSLISLCCVQPRDFSMSARSDQHGMILDQIALYIVVQLNRKEEQPDE